VGPAFDPRRAPAADAPLLRASAVSGEGIGSLGRHIAARLIPDVPAVGAAVPFTERHVDLLTQALSATRLGEIAAAQEILLRFSGD
jgi:hypothetical protein